MRFTSDEPGAWMPGAGVDVWGTSRTSPLVPGAFLAHADMHNHTLLSDGDGDPAQAFESLRDSGLDVAAITDHTSPGGPYQPRGIDQRAWRMLDHYAELAHREGLFVAVRGFEWSDPRLGHLNVWGSADFTTPQRRGTSMAGLHRWLATADGLGGPPLASMNHPGREPYRFDGFRYAPEVAQQLVGLELFNRYDDFLFEGVDRGEPSPLVECLDAGWRPALIGATDEHGEDWGLPDGKGRTGLFVRELSWPGVREALLARRAFASRLKGLRFAATIGGVLMGGVLRSGGVVPVEVDLDLGPSAAGEPALLQVLLPGPGVPEVALEVDLGIIEPGGPLRVFELNLDLMRPSWVVLRVSLPGRAIGLATGTTDDGSAVAYASPVWVQPGGRRRGQHLPGYQPL